MAGPAVGRLHSGRPGETESAGYACRRSSRCVRGRGFDSRRLHFSPLRAFFRSELFGRKGVDRNGCPQLLAPDLAELRLKVGGRALDVDVRGRADVGVAEKLLGGVDVAGREVELGAGRVAGAMHLLAAPRALVNDASAGEAAVSPAMERGSG